MRRADDANPSPGIVSRISRRLPSKVTVTLVDDAGVEVVVRGPDRVVDVLFDGRRIWSFWVLRDTERERGVRRCVAWPDRMRPYLDGRTRLSVVDHVADQTLFDEELAFGTGEHRIAFVNKSGIEISLDKSGRFSPTFSVRSERELAPLLDAMEKTVALLDQEGVVAFPAWGSLLGAVREGDLLGHDSDADFSYISRWTTPVDVTRESFALQRRLNAGGFETYRYSGAAFRIRVVEGDGANRGLDLFSAFYDHGRLYVMGEVGTDYREDWLYPYTTCRIADREFPAPARPEKMLEAMYGPGWRVPDPAFQFTTPDDVTQRLDGWFRGLSPYRREWEAHLAGQTSFDRRPSQLARLLHDGAPADATVLDVGMGRGADSLWLAKQGRSVIGYDFASKAGRPAMRIAQRRGDDLTRRHLNLTELRSVFGEGARMSRQDGRRVLLARHLLDATTRLGRQNLARFASMTLRGGGRLYADVWTGGGDGGFGLRPVQLDEVVELVGRHGGTVESAQELTTGDPGGESMTVGRVIAEWT